jgi:hypothetical protein
MVFSKVGPNQSIERGQIRVSKSYLFQEKKLDAGIVQLHVAAVPRQNDDQPLNQHFASRPVTLLKVKFSLLSEFWRRTASEFAQVSTQSSPFE